MLDAADRGPPVPDLVLDAGDHGTMARKWCAKDVARPGVRPARCPRVVVGQDAGNPGLVVLYH